MNHLTFEEISDLAETGAASAHLDGCDACRASLERVRSLLAAARALPRDVAPPPEVWQTVRARVASDRIARRGSPSRWWHNGWIAAAAAVVLVLGTATFMGLVSRGRSPKARAVMTATSPASAAVLTVDRNYAGTIRDLRATLDAQRSTLDPSTVHSVERSLRVIDDAIAEARAALAADPANQALVDILGARYEGQVDLLQRATRLSPTL